MSADWRARVVRRLAVVALSVGVIGIAVGAVNVAAQWRAAEAPLDVSPVSMDTIRAGAATEADRTASLSGQVDDAAAALVGLGTALTAANGNLSGDAANAQALRHQLDRATARLATLQGQLKAAQARLAQLNAAAARQAALNAAARAAGNVGGGTTASGGGGEPEDEDEGEDDR